MQGAGIGPELFVIYTDDLKALWASNKIIK